jgi:transcription elongation factor GreA
MSETHLSQAAYDRLQAELVEMTTRGRVDIARAIESARALGDLSENGDYHAAKDSQGKMEARIRQLQQILKDAVIVDDKAIASDVIGTGCVVTLTYDVDDDDEAERYLIGSIEERREDMSVISPSSPLGQALLGHRAGDLVEYQAPSGALRVKVLGVGA